METLFGPAWILGALLAGWGLVLVLVLAFVYVLRGIDFRSAPVRSRLDGETRDQGRLTTFPPAAQLFLGGHER